MDPLQTVPVQPIPSSNGPSLLDQKRAEVAQASQQKQSEIAPSQQLLSEYNADRVTLSNIELRNKYGEHLARQQEAKQLRQYLLDQTARRNRTSGELTQDGALSVLAGGVNLVAGLPVALEDLTLRGVYGLGQLGAMGLNASGALSDEHFNQFVDATNKDREAFVGPQQQVLGKFNNWRNAKSSVVKQADQTVMGQENAAVEAQNQQAYDQVIKRGDNAAAAMLLREAKNSWQGASNLFNHSSSLADMITEQLPTLGVGAVAKSLVAESKVASLAAKIAGEGASKEVLAAATKKAEETLLHRNISKVVTATEVGSNYGQQAGDIQTAPLKDLIERFPQVRAQLDAGVPEADIRNKLASDTAMTTAALTAPIAYGSSILSRPFLAHVGGKGVPATLKKFGVNVAEQLGEAGEEYLQGAGGQIAQNVANKQAGDTSVQDILQGTGEQAGQGAAAALGSAAAARAPGLAVGGAVLAGKAGLATAIGAGKLTIDGLAKVANATGKPDKAKAAQQAPVQAQKAEVGAQMDKNADTLSKGFQAQSVPTADGVAPEPTPAAKVATAPVESSPMLDPKEVAALKQNQEDPAAPLDTVTALSRAVQMLNDAPEHHSSISGLSLFAMKAARQLRQHMDTITDPVMKDAANKLLNSEWVTHLEEQAQHVTDDQINQAVAELPADTVPKDAPMTPEGRQALARTAELAALVPEKLSTEQTKRALLQSQHLTPEEIHQLEQANKLARVRESFQASTEALAKQQPSIKKFTEVTANIFNKGFQLGNKELPSLNTMAGNVVRALGNGHTQVALQSMKEMRQFVQSRIDRAAAFDQAARQHVENGSVENQRVKVAGTRQLATETSLGKEANYVDVTNPGSRALIDVVHNDASAAAEFFNTLAAENPSLNQQAIEAPAEASWKSMTKGDGVAAPGSAVANKPVAEAPTATQAPATKTKTSEDKVSGAVQTMQPKVAAVLDYALNPPADATPEKMREHIATMKAVEKMATTSLGTTHPEEQMSQHNALTDLRSTAKAARETLEASLATHAELDAKATSQGDTLRDARSLISSVENRAYDATLKAAKEKHGSTVDLAKLQDPEMDALYEQKIEEFGKGGDYDRAVALVANQHKEAVEANKRKAAEAYAKHAQKEQEELKKGRRSPTRNATEAERINDKVVRAAYEMTKAQLQKEIEKTQYRYAHSTPDPHAAVDPRSFIAMDLASLNRVFNERFGASSAPDAELEATPVVSHPVEANPVVSTNEANVEGKPAPVEETEPVAAVVEEAAPAETKKPTTVAERFPGLTETLGEVTDSTPADEKQARSNKFLSSFKLAGKSQSLFTRFADPMTALKKAFAKGISGVRDLYVEDLRYLNPTEAQMGAMEALLVHVAPEIARRMNEHLLQTAKGTGKSQGFLQNLLNPAEAKTAKGKTKVEWAFSNRLPLHAAVWGTDAGGKPFLHYQEGIVQAVSIAAVHWLMNQQNAPIDFDEEKLDKRFPNMSEELRSAFRTMANKDALLERLASDIQQVMGVHADGDASQSYTAGIPLALAQQAIVAMQQMGMLEVVPVEAGTNAETGKATTVTFLRMNKNAQTKGINPQALRDALGQPALLTRLLMPDSRTLPFIGKPAKAISDLMTRTRQKLAKGQLLALKKYGEVPYHANTHFIQDMKALGKDVYLLLRGFDIQDTSKLNRNHADSVEGKNRSLEAAWDAVMELDAQVGMYADENATEDGNPLAGVKVFFPASMGSNTRMFMDASVNPQGDKDMREAFVPTEAKYDFANNPRHMAPWFSAIGQALDLGWKVEQIASLEVLSQMVQERLAEKNFSKVLEAWQAMQAAEPGSKEQRSLAKKVHFLLSKIYGDKAVPAHGLHALSDLARYHASEDKGSFTSALPIEIDGKTDGPFHATWHLGLHAFGKKMLQQLRQSGALINTSMRSLNEGGSALGDMYKNVGKAAKGLIQDKLAKLVEKPLARKSMQATIELLRMIDHVEVVRDEDGKPVDYNVTRAPGKLATTPIIYGSSANSVLKTMANAIISSVYKQLSESIASGEPLSPALQERLQATMGYYKESGEAKYAPKFDLSDPAKYKDFSFDPAHRKALVYSLQYGAGGSLTESVETELAPVLDTFKSLYKAAAFQMFQYQTEFNAAREALRLQRVEEGKLGPNDALSRNDEQQLLQDLNAKAPIYQLMHSAGLSKDFGISIVKTDTGGRHVVNGEEQQVRAMGAGHLSAHIPAVILQDAGVRIAALLVQGLGDASMITELGTNNPDGMLPVFDGLGVSPLEFAKWGKEANQAVLKTILFNGLKSVNDSFANSDMDFSKIDRSQLDALVEALRPDQDTAAELEDAADAEVVAYLEKTRSDERAKLLHRADVIDATKRALLTEGRTQVSQDHMAGAGPEGAVQIEGPIKNDQVLIAEIKARVAEQVGKPVESTKPTENPKTVSDVLANLSKDGLKTLDSLTLQPLINNMPLQGKIRQFVYKQIAHLLPNDLQVHVGTHAEIAAKQAELFPDVDFGTERDVGATYENHVFVENNSEETLVHELVHAAVTSLLSRYYQHDGKGLNQSQKMAIAELEKLAQLFAATKVTRAMHPRIVDALRAVQAHLAGGHKGAAVNEFLAWSMTNGAVQQNLAKTPLSLPAQFKAITKTALGIIRRLLGLPKNEPVDSFLAQALSNFRQLTQRAPIEDGLDVGSDALFQSLSGSEDERLAELSDKLGWLRTNFPKDGTEEGDAILRELTNNERAQKAMDKAESIRRAFEDAGFQFTEAGRHVFTQMQALLATNMQLDSRALDGMQHLYEEVMPYLSEDDFTTPEQYEALQAIGTKEGDLNERSNMLANFISLALVDPTLREKLADLKPAKPNVDKSTFDKRLRSYGTAVFDILTDASNGRRKGDSQLVVLDRLVAQLDKNQRATLRRQNAKGSLMDRAESVAKKGIVYVGEKAAALKNARHDAGLVGGVDGLINGVLNIAHAMSSPEGSEAFGEGLLSLSNKASATNPIAKLLRELVSRTGSNAQLVNLLDKSKWAVSHVRQRLREEAPAQVRALFKEPLSKETWKLLTKAVGKADMAALMDNYTRTEIQEMLDNPEALDKAIKALHEKLGEHGKAYIEGAQDLAHYIMTGDNISAGLLYRNAHALSRLSGSQTAVDPEKAAKVAPYLDRLASLYAMQKLSQEDRKATAELMAKDSDGMEKLLRLMKTLGRREYAKLDADKQLLNAQKGYLPESMDPRSHLVLAGLDDAADRVKRGYRFVGSYQGDASDVNGGHYGYYAIDTVGGQATYNQGALQMVTSSIGGADHLTGRSNNVAVQTMIMDPHLVEAITKSKHEREGLGDRNLIPVFNADGEIIGYQRTLSSSMIFTHLRTNDDLAQSIGNWMGRQAEETFSRELNMQLGELLRKDWDKNKEKLGDEYIDISHSDAKSIQDGWNSIPPYMRKHLKELFRGPVMVRKNQVDMAIGYRAASIADVFTGMSDLDEKTQQAIADAALGFLGKDAYRKLVRAERIVQGVVGMAKETIVVKSLTVGLANFLSNSFQLLMHGVPPWRLLQVQSAKARELETYMRREKRISQLSIQLATTTNPALRKKLNREHQAMHDANTRLSIWPLIESGELPSIAEGLSESDEYSIMHDFATWISEKTKDLPPGVISAAKMATLAKGTALHQGLNRLVQFGDFMAKAVLYDDQIARGKSKEEALSYINDRFVNYNIPAGRTRDYLESMGLTWFWNYKLRIQKVVLATIRDNPIRFLMWGLTAGHFGVGNLLSDNALNTNWSYSIGPGQLPHAGGMLMWSQLFGR